ncbi:MAG: imidazole glycerol phosphate synthase subunit HisH [Pseudomonadales bacterium]|uniref:Imidazole glycerol phosphate synthase subunit HisH n=1 Tax=Oleiphilus messinensis TaxID=141451 RepID=A0A1Y0ICI2_9GAMM|nr:imidazole glycerol phosphate synthase subunit HisH [Oleiphilus messinensis]ARU58171.1 imidazole glycerol phosphate synthase subunit HisH [Oleiphilus messinensis]MCG8609760.1 imidazole glycerol phosphate synthase subunit HisH [Pseudomonadales bacterium]
MNTIAVIDYGMGNLHSVSKALEHVAPDARVLVTADPKTVLDADRVLLPGVGAIRDCMAEIRRLGFDDLVRTAAKDRPFLGICVGMQALMSHSEENNGVDCLGLFPEKVRYFGEPLIGNPELGEAPVKLKVPHMGWNQVSQDQDHPLWHGIPDQSRFYFVHSYYAEPAADGSVYGSANYGKKLAAAVGRDNVFAVQFHPEKSHEAGLQLLKNFAHWSGNL